jgi:hypothetical protein
MATLYSREGLIDAAYVREALRSVPSKRKKQKRMSRLSQFIHERREEKQLARSSSSYSESGTGKLICPSCNIDAPSGRCPSCGAQRDQGGWRPGERQDTSEPCLYDLQTLEPERAQAAQELQPFADGTARTKDWKALLECGAPAVQYVFLPSRWRPGRWSRRDLRLLQAIGLAGATVRLLNAHMPFADMPWVLQEVIRHWDPYVTVAALPLGPVEATLESDPRFHDLYEEVMLFEQHGWALYDCPGGDHYHSWIGPHTPRFPVACPAHRSAELKARQRSKSRKDA